VYGLVVALEIVKLFERLIQDTIITHITRNRIISFHQHGFQSMPKIETCRTPLVTFFQLEDPPGKTTF
jgi:hypothetical protein